MPGFKLTFHPAAAADTCASSGCGLPGDWSAELVAEGVSHLVTAPRLYEIRACLGHLFPVVQHLVGQIIGSEHLAEALRRARVRDTERDRTPA